MILNIYAYTEKIHVEKVFRRKIRAMMAITMLVGVQPEMKIYGTYYIKYLVHLSQVWVTIPDMDLSAEKTSQKHETHQLSHKRIYVLFKKKLHADLDLVGHYTLFVPPCLTTTKAA